MKIQLWIALLAMFGCGSREGLEGTWKGVLPGLNYPVEIIVDKQGDGWTVRSTYLDSISFFDDGTFHVVDDQKAVRVSVIRSSSGEVVFKFRDRPFTLRLDQNGTGLVDLSNTEFECHTQQNMFRIVGFAELWGLTPEFFALNPDRTIRVNRLTLKLTRRS